MNNQNFIITVSGTPGSGKTTLAKLLAEHLNCKYIYVGNIRRKLAREKNMTLEELNLYALEHPETDVNIDRQVATQARIDAKQSPIIVEGRTQFHFLPESIKIYIKVDDKEGAKRIWAEIQNKQASQQRNEGQYKSAEEVEQKIKTRQQNDRTRYLKYYNIDQTDESQYDLIVDTTELTPDQGLAKILDFLQQKGIKTINI